MKRMHDPKFEKEVQKKLEELSFSPSEAVWTRVERAVNEKRRRRTPLFWFFLLPSLGLAGAGIIYFSKHQTAPAAQVVRTAPAPASSTPGDKAAAVTPTPPIAQATPGQMTQSVQPVHRSTSRKIPSDQTIHPNSISSADQATHPDINTSSDLTAHQDIIPSSDLSAHQDIASSPDPAVRQDKTSSGSVSYAGLPG